jgi:hypothetical protein
MDGLKIPVVETGGGYLKAILLNGQETIWGRAGKKLAGRLKRRPAVLGVHPMYLEQALDIAGSK